MIDTYVYRDSIVELHVLYVRTNTYICTSTPPINQKQSLKVETRQILLCNNESRCGLSSYPFDPGICITPIL